MKRNQRSRAPRQVGLNPLTEHILSQMGPAGWKIRQRLQRFYHGHDLQEQRRPRAPGVLRPQVEEESGDGEGRGQV
jgi:hypothetical protein